MSVRALDLYHIASPLKKTIRHASHARTESDNLVVRVRLASGHEGFGEGVPRPYVTGETIDSTFAALSAFDWAGHLGQPRSYEDVVRRLEALELPETANDPRGMSGNAARCALEIAILDAYGQAFGQPLGQALHYVKDGQELLNGSPAWVRYSGAITSESRLKEDIAAGAMLLYGFAQVKIKVGVAGQNDAARLWRMRLILGYRTDLRLDANEAWKPEELPERVAPLLRYKATALEQPVPHEQVEALAEHRGKLGIPIMLDESLCGYPDGLRAIEQGTADLFNVRLSKCGGLIPSLRLMALARRNGLGVQLGCHPGETGILSAAGRHVAANVQGLRYVEGSYDRHILSKRLTHEDMTFGFGGWARPLRGPGLGVRVDPAMLEQMTLRHQELRYD